MKHVMYYVTYDISENATRDSVTEILKDAGMTRIQKSVFCGSLSAQQRKDLVEQLRTYISEDSDSLYLLTSCNQCFGRTVTLGKRFDADYVSDRIQAVVL